MCVCVRYYILYTYSRCNILCVWVNCNMLAHARKNNDHFLSQSRSEMFTSLIAA